MTKPHIVGPEYIAELLGIEVSTVKIDALHNIAQLFGPSLLQHQGVTGVAVSDASHFDKLRCTRSE